MTQEQMFECRMAAWRRAIEREAKIRRDLKAKYGETWSAPNGARTRHERASDAVSTAGDRVFSMLDEVSPRQWRTGAPYYWIAENMTWQLATTRNCIPIPPVCFGQYPSDAVRFASAV